MAPRQAAQATRSVPTVAIQRSSVDRQREPKTNQPKQVNTGPITRWLEYHGIPVNSTRQKKPKKSKDPENSEPQSSQISITASNVTTMELETYFKWIFQTSAESVAESTVLETVSISKVLNGIVQLSESGFTSEGEALDGRIGTMISLPVEWTKNTGSDDSEVYWRRALMAFLTIHDPNHNYVNFPSTKKIKAATYPNPNVFHMHNERLEGGGITWSLTNTLASPTFIKPPKTEMDVEHLNSGFLSGFFNVPECETSSNAQVTFREEITCFGSQSRPDFATRIGWGIILEKRLQHDLYPAVLFAEGKREPLPEETQIMQSGHHLQVPSGKSPGAQYPMVAQLAFGAYPSLVIIIAHLIMEWQSKPKGKKIPKREDYQIPEWAVIYGIGYAGNGIIIYALFPRVIEWGQDNFPTKWGFMSVVVTTDFLSVFTEVERSRRFDLIRFLLMVQQHANRLKDHMKDLRLPEVFLG